MSAPASTRKGINVVGAACSVQFVFSDLVSREAWLIRTGALREDDSAVYYGQSSAQSNLMFVIGDEDFNETAHTKLAERIQKLLPDLSDDDDEGDDEVEGE